MGIILVRRLIYHRCQNKSHYHGEADPGTINILIQQIQHLYLSFLNFKQLHTVVVVKNPACRPIFVLYKTQPLIQILHQYLPNIVEASISIFYSQI